MRVGFHLTPGILEPLNTETPTYLSAINKSFKFKYVSNR